MQERKSLLRQLLEGLHDIGPGRMGALVGLLIGILWVSFGFWRTFFILMMSALGYAISIRYFANRERFRELLDKLFPPGLFR